MVGFYELQLVFLVSSCLILLFLERHVSRQKDKEKDLHVVERLENGEPTPSRNSLAALTRQYLLVYAIVMGV
jgi:hypothetical protein